jgi:hypothetical protein
VSSAFDRAYVAICQNREPGALWANREPASVVWMRRTLMYENGCPAICSEDAWFSVLGSIVLLRFETCYFLPIDLVRREFLVELLEVVWLGAGA